MFLPKWMRRRGKKEKKILTVVYWCIGVLITLDAHFFFFCFFDTIKQVVRAFQLPVPTVGDTASHLHLHVRASDVSYDTG